MARRQQSPESGLETFVVHRQVADQLSVAIAQTLETISTLRRQVLVDVIVNNLSVGDIATKHGITRERVRSEFGRAISNLRHPTRSQVLSAHSGSGNFGEPSFGDGLDEQVLRQVLGGSALGTDGVTVEWVKCELHGAQHVISTAAKCQGCPCELPRERENPTGYDLSESGRPRKYCSDACRQRAYRRRKKQDTT